MVKWRDGFDFSADAEKVWEELNSIGEGLTPEIVVKKARDPGTELHKCFVWDDKRAAEIQRLHQARIIINHIVVEISNPDDEDVKLDVSYYTSIPTDAGRTYVPTIQSLAQPELRQIVLNEAVGLFRRGKEKLAAYNLLSHASSEMINQIIRRLYRRIGKKSRRAA